MSTDLTASTRSAANVKTQAYADSVMRQGYDIPVIYGEVDFSIEPERFDRETAATERSS
jgi:hypothetical protein